MPFRISGLAVEPFLPLFGLDDESLARAGAVRYVADAKPGFPVPITLEDAEPGESVLLLNHVYQAAETPYRGSHAIFVRESAVKSATFVDEVPASLRTRLLSVRAFDEGGSCSTRTSSTERSSQLVERFFSNRDVAYIHVHNAKGVATRRASTGSTRRPRPER